jgi:glutamate-1-semialdehyde 2,1-aminomutase
VVAAVQAQAADGVQYGAGCPQAVEWAEAIQRLVPSAERVEFVNSGTEAILYGIRLARAFTGRPKVVRFQYHFGGAYDAVAVGNKKPFDVPVSAGVLPGAVQDTVVIPMNEAAALENALRHRDVAVVMLEAAGSSSGVVGIDPTYYEVLREATAKHGTLLFFDEVVTGFRYAPGGVQAAVGVTPDLTALGKGVSGVMPGAGAIVGRAEVLAMLELGDERWNRYGRVTHSGTFNANPLCAAAGIAYLDRIATGGPTAAANCSARRLCEGFQSAMDAHGIGGCAWDAGFSTVHVYFGPCSRRGTCDRRVCLNAEKTREPALGQALFMNLALNGVKTPTRGYDLFVSAVHTADDLERTVDAFGRALDALGDEGMLAASMSSREGAR